jgi:flagella basal body P-ring formation protein FlgA
MTGSSTVHWLLAMSTLFGSASTGVLARAHAAPSPLAVITFRSSGEVRGSAIRLADVAVVESARPQLVASLEAVQVGAAPLWGHSRTVTAEYAKVCLRQLGLDVERIRIRGPELITVTRPEQRLPGEALEKAAADAVATANPSATVQITFAPREVSLPAGVVTLKPQAVPITGGASGVVSIRVLVDGRETTEVPVSFRLLRRAPAVIAARDLPMGTVLTAGDLTVEERPVVPGPLLLSDASLAVGQQVALPVQAGTVLTQSMVKPAVLIRRGSRVRLICKGPNFVVTAAGEALQDAAAGQLVRCRNLTSLGEVTATVIGEETAEVAF